MRIRLRKAVEKRQKVSESFGRAKLKNRQKKCRRKQRKIPQAANRRFRRVLS